MNSAGNDANPLSMPMDGAVVGTLALDGQPEFVVSDGKGKIFVNITDKNEISRVIDGGKLEGASSLVRLLQVAAQRIVNWIATTSTAFFPLVSTPTQWVVNWMPAIRKSDRRTPNWGGYRCQRS